MKLKMKYRKIIFLVTCYSLVFILTGCEAFVRKFTRKSKKSDQAVELVLEPEEYKGPGLSKEELYRQHMLYWKSWHDEFINALDSNSSGKKKVDCANEALKSLTNMQLLLEDGYKLKLGVYITKLTDLRSSVGADIYGASNRRNAQSAEKLKINIMRDFSYSKIKRYML